MKHSLQLKLSQHLTLTPQLQQSIRLLQLSTLELNQEIETFLQENPLLERDEEEEGAGVAQPPGTLSPTTTTATATESTPAGEGDGGEDRGAAEMDWSVDDGYGSFGSQDGDDESDAPLMAAEPTKLRDHLLEAIAQGDGERDWSALAEVARRHAGEMEAAARQ